MFLQGADELRMIIGDTVAAAHYDRSKLYDPEFTTEFREAVKSKTHHS